MTRDEAIQMRKQMENTFSLASVSMTNDQIIENSALCKAWDLGKHEVDEIRTVNGYPYKCIQSHDTDTHPDIVPGNAAWGTFWIPFHGTTVETALPFVPPTGAHDMYKVGEYMTLDGVLYRCKADTAYSPVDYADAWELV